MKAQKVAPFPDAGTALKAGGVIEDPTRRRNIGGGAGVLAGAVHKISGPHRFYPPWRGEAPPDNPL